MSESATWWDDTDRRRRVGDPVLTLSLVALVLGAPYYFFSAGMELFTFGGEAVDAASRDAAHQDMVIAGVLLIVAPAVATAAALLSERETFAWVMLVVSVVAIGVVLAARAENSAANPRPDPTPTHRVCQEHSGGDTRCPGG